MVQRQIVDVDTPCCLAKEVSLTRHSVSRCCIVVAPFDSDCNLLRAIEAIWKSAPRALMTNFYRQSESERQMG